jgi:GH24 family phage-related lysozyme (muramidase)
MLPGFGLFRRFTTLALVAFAFWAGLHFAHTSSVDRCIDAGGTVRADGLCRGLP